MSKTLSLLFLILIIDNFNSVYSENEYKLNIIDNSLKTSNFSSILLDENGFYYVITGENYDPNYNPDAKLFKRCILKFDSDSNILVNKYEFNSTFPLGISKTFFFEKYMHYILTISKNSIEFFNEITLAEYEKESLNIIGRQDVFKVGPYIYNAFILESIENNKTEHYMQISKYEIYEGEHPFFKILNSSQPINIAPYLSTISCSTTKDKRYILCAYYSKFSLFTIAFFDINLRKLHEEIGDILEEKNKIDMFMKMLYFKDDNKFIIINSLNNYYTRIRYLKFVHNELIDLLYIITNNEGNYLDVKETPYNPIWSNNDIVALENKIIKISFYKNKIIITIFHFIYHDTNLFIKTYKLLNNEQDFFSSKNMNPTLNIIKNNVLISLSKNYEQKPLMGYFFLNYPNLKELNLTKSSFLVEELVTIENAIFDLEVKLKVLEIPSNCIFLRHNISDSNYKEIKEGDILELGEEIILRQYKIEKGSLLFRYKAIALGKDSGFSSYKLYPSDAIKPEDSDIYLEGREGSLSINFEKCFEGYHKIADNFRVCTNSNPERHYFDKEDNIYKKCTEPCLECSGPFISNEEMNCISCLDNYIITEDTKSCYSYVPLNYILEDNILKRCHPLCSKCSKVSKNDSEMNCLKCQDGFFLKTDTYNCIDPLKFKKHEKESLTQKNNKFNVLFIIILVFSIMTSLIISINCLNNCIFKTKYAVQNDEEENQNIKDKLNNKNEKSLISESEKSIELTAIN